MARGINKVILIGNLGADPEVRYLTSGTAVANLSLATTDVRKDRTTGEQQELTEWHRVVLFSRLAEIAEQFLKKGSKVYLEGRLQTRKWQDKSGNDRYTTEIVANEMQMLDGRQSQGDSFATDKIGATQFAKPATQNNNTVTTQDFDDDIPF